MTQADESRDAQPVKRPYVRRKPAPEQSVALSTGEAARLLGVSQSAIRDWRIAGKLPGTYRTAGGHWRVPTRVLLAMRDRATV